jgi:hypothetical protein
MRSKVFSTLISAVAVVAVGAATPPTTSAAPVLSGAPATNTLGCGTLAHPRHYKHVIVIVEENTSYDQIYKSASAPYLNSVIAACGLAANYANITHHSLPNYLGMTDGATLSELKPFVNDCPPVAACEVKSSNIFAQLNKHGGWREYAESMGKACDRMPTTTYSAWHNPVLYYSDLKDCASYDLPLGTSATSPLLKAFAAEKTAPALAFVTPNLCDDMHGATGCESHVILAGDNWLKKWLPLLTVTKVYKAGDTAIFITWDEGKAGSTGENCTARTSDQSCHVPAIVVAPSVKKGTIASARFTHYSLLRTVESLLGLPVLGLAKTANGMERSFNL